MKRDSSIQPPRTLRIRGYWLSILAVVLVHAALAQNVESVRLIGVGTTSPLPVYSKWFQEFEKIRPDLHIIYVPSGSETGIDMVISGNADFGATDAPMPSKTLAKAKVLQFATLLVALVPIYNIPGLSRPLNFSPQALAGIYLGTITRWNDPAISTANPQVQLPASKIVVLHSVAGRGSTYIWSDYLSKVSAEWRTKVGRGMAVEWPVGKEAEGNSNLARMVKQVSNSIGYVELVYAVQNQLPSGLVQNAAGNFIAADSSSITAAGAAAVRLTPSDWRTSITNPPGDRSYPITSFTWILFSENVGSASKQEAIKQFLRWALEDGQSNVEPAGFAPLPKTIVETELRSLEGMP